MMIIDDHRPSRCGSVLKSCLLADKKTMSFASGKRCVTSFIAKKTDIS